MSLQTLDTLIRRLILVVISLAATGAAGGDVSVVFRDSSCVAVAQVTLGDIARVESSDPVLARRLSGLVVGDAAPAGYSRFFGSGDLALTIRRSAAPALVSLSGSPRIKVATASVSGKLSDYAAIIKTFVAAGLTWAEKDRSIELRTERDFKFLPGAVVASVRGTVKPHARGPIPLILVLENGGRTIEVPVACVVKVTTSVLVSAEQIGNGKVIVPAALRSERRDITNLSAEPLVTMAEASGLLSLRTILPGTILSSIHVRRAPEVLNNDNITMTCRSGVVTLSIRAIARGDGALGEQIWVENLESRKLVRATVTGKGTVAVGNGV